MTCDLPSPVKAVEAWLPSSLVGILSKFWLQLALSVEPHRGTGQGFFGLAFSPDMGVCPWGALNQATWGREGVTLSPRSPNCCWGRRSGDQWRAVPARY